MLEFLFFLFFLPENQYSYANLNRTLGFFPISPINKSSFSTDIIPEMRQTQEKAIKTLLQQGQSKKAIFKKLASDTNQDELTNQLNNLPLANRRKKTYIITLFLVILLTLLTTKQVLFIYLHENSNVSLILGFIAPIIHVYVIRELLLSHRLAYQILPLLSILALFRPENRIEPDMYMYACMAILSGALYLFLFPKKEQLQFPTH